MPLSPTGCISDSFETWCKKLLSLKCKGELAQHQIEKTWHDTYRRIKVCFTGKMCTYLWGVQGLFGQARMLE